MTLASAIPAKTGPKAGRSRARPVLVRHQTADLGGNDTDVGPGYPAEICALLKNSR